MESAIATVQRVDAAVGALQPSQALAAILDYASDLNRYIDERAPWKAGKAEPGSEAKELAGTTLHNACEGLRVIALLLAPFLPESAHGIATRIGQADLIGRSRLPSDAMSWGQVPAGTRVAKGTALFPRLEKPTE
jgi:methionyl-tRNA synthetase